MFHRLVLAIVVLMIPHTGATQLGVLRITVVVADASGQATSVPRYRLQISDNPASAVPRRVITSLDGTVEVRLAPGNYTVESERPLTVGEKAYQWTMVVDIVGGRDLTLELTAENAESVAPGATAAPPELDPSSLLAQWQDSVAAIWTATTRGSGVLVDTRGLIATDQSVIGAATSVEVQLSPTVKVAGSVIVSDVTRGLALVRIHPAGTGAAKALPLECQATPEALAVGEEVTALEAPLGRLRGTRTGAIDGVHANVIETDLESSAGGSGGPVFAPSGRLVGLTTQVPERDGQGAGRTGIVRIRRLCELIASEAEAFANTPPPAATHLPVESHRPFPPDAAGAGATGRATTTSLYRMSSSDFDISFITPVQLRDPGARSDNDERMLTEFSNWSEYVAATPPVLLIRVTPKLTEGFWTRVARGAALLQGASIPPIKRFKAAFASMRALCGTTEIVPVHPFRLEHRLSDKDTLVEGLYAFDPGALTPTCTTVTLQLFSEKKPRNADTAVVAQKVIEQIWQDFAPHRAVK